MSDSLKNEANVAMQNALDEVNSKAEKSDAAEEEQLVRASTSVTNDDHEEFVDQPGVGPNVIAVTPGLILAYAQQKRYDEESARYETATIEYFRARQKAEREATRAAEDVADSGEVGEAPYPTETAVSRTSNVEARGNTQRPQREAVKAQRAKAEAKRSED